MWHQVVWYIGTKVAEGYSAFICKVKSELRVLQLYREGMTKILKVTAGGTSNLTVSSDYKFTVLLKLC
jgi:hypothetical protein